MALTQVIGIGIRFTAKDQLSGKLLAIEHRMKKFLPGVGQMIGGLRGAVNAGGIAAGRAGAAMGLLAHQAFSAISTMSAAMTSSFKRLLKLSGDYQSVITQIGIASGQTGAYLGELAAEILKVTGPLPTTAKELAKATFAFAKMGFAISKTAKELTQFALIAVKFGRATGFSDEQSALFLSRLATWLGVTDPTSKDLEKIGSAVARVGFFIRGTAEDVIKATERFGAFAIALGFSKGEVIALAGHIKDSGIRIRRGSTAILRTLQQMVLRLDDFAQAMTKAKVVASPAEFKRMFKVAPMEAFNKVLEATNKQWGGSAAMMLRNLGIVGTYIADLITMSKNQGRLGKSIGRSTAEIKDAMFLESAFNKMKKTFNQRLVAAQGAWDNLKITIGSRLLPVLTVLAEKLTGILTWLIELDPWVYKIAGALLVGAVVGLYFAKVFLAIKLALALLTFAAGGAAVSMWALLWPVLAVIGAVAALVMLIAYLTGGFDAFKKISKGLKDIPAASPTTGRAFTERERATMASIERRRIAAGGKIRPTTVPGGMATGNRVVTKPTIALLGEKKKEFVLTEDQIATQVARAVGGGPRPVVREQIVKNVTVPIVVNLDGREIASAVQSINVEERLREGRSLDTEYYG
jgi:TP901 family phage tail tape measure protein